MGRMRSWWRVVTRRRALDEANGDLARCLGLGDLTALGVGSTLGVGIYVVAGQVARTTAGPAVLLSFLLAAGASLLAGLCYAEFASRVPRAGSAYMYSYVCVGELVAFIVGWNLVLEYVIGAASVARGISLYVDSLLGDILKNYFRSALPVHVPFFAEYFDLLAFSLALLLGVMLAFGLKKSSVVNNVFTSLNICVVIFVIIIGCINADIGNWQLTGEALPAEAGDGGFFPFGAGGVVQGAATCFYGFVGFDCIASSGEEARRPQQTLPLAIMAALAIVTAAYLGVSAALTLMFPYYLQDVDAPIPVAMAAVGLPWARWVVAIGALFGLFSSLFGALFTLPRIVYAMAADGLLPHFLAVVSSRFRTPLLATLLGAVLTGGMAGLFELSQLVNMMSIGTLMAYTVVASCVLLLRCEPETPGSEETAALLANQYEDPNPAEVCEIRGPRGMHSALKGRLLGTMLGCNTPAAPTARTYSTAATLFGFYCLLSVALALVVCLQWESLRSGDSGTVGAVIALGAALLLCLALLYRQPQRSPRLAFQVPLVPLLPCLSVSVNIGLVIMLDSSTWIRFGIWMAIGLPLYLTSMWVYKRGSNYITRVQKSSINGYKTGNLNYAFNNGEECCQRSSVKIVVHNATPPLPRDPEVDSTLRILDTVLKEHDSVFPTKIALLVSSHSMTTTVMSVSLDADASLHYTVMQEDPGKIIKEDCADYNIHIKGTPSDEENYSEPIETVKIILSNDVEILNSSQQGNEAEGEVINLNIAEEIVQKVEESTECFIPLAPPMDYNYFTDFDMLSSSPQKFCRKNINKKSSEEQEINCNSDNIEKVESRNSFLKRLNTLLKNQSSTERLPNSFLKRSASSHALADRDMEDEARTDLHRHGSQPDLKPEDDTFSDPEVPLSRSEIMAKLEMIFAVSPTVLQQRLPRPEKLKSKDSTHDEESNQYKSFDEVIKPKYQENYTNTMKLQRARFGDVLKSIQFSQRQSSELRDQNIDDKTQTEL